MFKSYIFPVTLCTLTCFAGMAEAQTPSYQPDLLTLDGTSSLEFETNGALSILDGGTVEFWVAPDWSEAISYDPVMISVKSDAGILYEIAMQGDKQGINVSNADQTGQFAFNFDDTTVHHVAITNLNDGVVAMVDGNIIGKSGLEFANLKPQILAIGAAPGGNLPFNGVMGAVRIWGTALDPETLIAYNWLDVTQDETDHPDIEFLSGYSEFETEDFIIVDKPIVPTWLVADRDISLPEETINE